jgi:hypothetical protein
VGVVARCWRGGASSLVNRRRGAVLLLGDVLTPRDGTTLVVGFLHRYVGHEALRGGAVPVVLAVRYPRSRWTGRERRGLQPRYFREFPFAAVRA